MWKERQKEDKGGQGRREEEKDVRKKENVE